MARKHHPFPWNYFNPWNKWSYFGAPIRKPWWFEKCSLFKDVLSMTSTRGTAMCSAICKTWEGRLGDPGKPSFCWKNVSWIQDWILRRYIQRKWFRFWRKKRLANFRKSQPPRKLSFFHDKKETEKKDWRKTTRSTLPKTANENWPRSEEASKVPRHVFFS